MKKTEEKGVTLVALVTTIVLLLIIVSIGTTAGSSAIEHAKFTQFKEELKVLQTKVNELNQNNQVDIGTPLTNEQKNILKISTISEIIYNGKSEEEKNKITEGFRYCNSNNIKNNLQFENIKRDYLINVEYRYIIYVDGFKYNETKYYMINQIEDGIYNVEYINKNPQTGSFKATCVKEDDRWKIEITNIQYEGYISNWEIKYKLDGEDWKKANGPIIYVTKEGNYYVQVLHEDINLGTQLVNAINE